MSYMPPANNVSLLLSGAQLAPSRESFFEQFDLPPGSDLVAQMQARPRLYQALPSRVLFSLSSASSSRHNIYDEILRDIWTASERPCC